MSLSGYMSYYPRNKHGGLPDAKLEIPSKYGKVQTGSRQPGSSWTYQCVWQSASLIDIEVRQSPALVPGVSSSKFSDRHGSCSLDARPDTRVLDLLPFPYTT
ncbi:hypothetical protein J6590_004118 [Homalodisca vitripennis]|nr:hypothetical protein J6590_004118 [Homalodisca vitripennis]